MLLPLVDSILHAGHGVAIFTFFRHEVDVISAMTNLSETHDQ